jgi:paraquat-inducible protein A
MHKLKHLGFFLNLSALALFIPGILQPMFSLTMDVTAQTNISQLSSELINKELSLIATIRELYQDERILVAALILFFSVIIPIIKSSLISFSYFTKNNLLARKVSNFVNAIGKWSMADVFVVAVFLALMSTNHAETQTQHQLSLFGFNVDLLLSSSTLSSVGVGFYYFTGYCIISMIASQVSYYALTHKHK